MGKRVGMGLVVALLLTGVGSAFSQQSSGDEYVPILPAQFLPKETKSPVFGWGMSLNRWHELMGNEKPKPKVPPTSTGPKYGGSPGSKFGIPLPSPVGLAKVGPLGGNGCGECLAEKQFSKWTFLPNSLCRHQLRWTDAWTKLPLVSKGIRLVGPEALAYGNPSLIYGLLYVGSQWALAGGKEIRVYAISTKDPIKTYVDSAEGTWWFSHMAGIDLDIRDILREYLRPGASLSEVNKTLANRMTTTYDSRYSSPYNPDCIFKYDLVEDQAHVGGHSVDIREFVSTRTNMALLKAIGKAKSIASAYIWNAIAKADTSHFIAPPSAKPDPNYSWSTYNVSPLHVALLSAGDSWKPIWNEYGRELWTKLCFQLGIYLVKTKGYSWKSQSWGNYYSQNPLQ